ncbi:hypothetical protein BaRGS_00011687, partial [Batillaria attramentaria]
MAKGILLLTVTGVFAMFLVCSATLKIRNCTNNILDVLEPGPHEIYCDGVGTDGRINWTITSMGETEQNVAYCATAFACETFLSESFYASPVSTTTATLSIKANHRSWAGATLKCVAQNDEVASCKLRVINGSVTGSGGTQSFPVAAVAGGVAASVLAIIVVIVIVLVIRRKCYRTYDRPNRRRDQDTNPYTGLRPTGAAANGNSGDVNTEGVYEEINPEQRQHPST